MTSKSDSIGVTCTRLRHFADTFSQWNPCRKKLTLGHMTENKCGYQMHIFVTSFSAQHAPAWRCFCMVQPLRQPFRPKCTNRILQMHHQNPVVPPESGVHPQNPVCTYSVILLATSKIAKCCLRFAISAATKSVVDSIVVKSNSIWRSTHKLMPYCISNRPLDDPQHILYNFNIVKINMIWDNYRYLKCICAAQYWLRDSFSAL